jgi:ABC-type lipoprotein export system ATPase subunit
MSGQAIVCENLVKIYKVADLEVFALQGLDLRVDMGEMLAIVGASGSGKSTLLNIMAGLDTPSAGKCLVAGHDLSRLNEADRTNYRRFVIGHVWQQSGRNLLPDATLAANVELPQMLGGISPHKRSRHARELLSLVGLAEQIDLKPSQLSGGQQQRAAIAVALANEPSVLLADEPTGELDSTTAHEIVSLLRTAQVDRTIAIRDGRTSTETVRRSTPAEDQEAGVLQKSAIIGLSAETHYESLIMDRVGRVQLPREALERIPYNGRVQARIFDDHVELWPIRNNTKR